MLLILDLGYGSGRDTLDLVVCCISSSSSSGDTKCISTAMSSGAWSGISSSFSERYFLFVGTFLLFTFVTLRSESSLLYLLSSENLPPKFTLES